MLDLEIELPVLVLELEVEVHVLELEVPVPELELVAAELGQRKLVCFFRLCCWSQSKNTWLIDIAT